MLHALKNHWRDYLLEAGGLMAFMLGAGAFGTLFLYPDSAVSQAIPSDLLKRAGLGLCMGLVTFTIVSVIGGRTGAHINPAVTWSFWRQGKIGGWDATFYTAAQFAGAIAAPTILLALIGDPFTHEKVEYATSQPGPAGDLAAFAAEFGMSFVLMLSILIVLDIERIAKWLPAIVGALIALYITVAAPISGMSLNPARTFGSALTAGQWSGLWIYFTAPPLAMLLAVELYLAARGRASNSDPAPHYPVQRNSRMADELMTLEQERPMADAFRGQKLPFPAAQSDMDQQPDSDLSNYSPANKLAGKVALITGADSGIGRAVAIAFAMEGAKVGVLYNENDGDAETTKGMIEERGGECLLLRHDIREAAECEAAVQETVGRFGQLDILVNNAAFQMAVKRFEDLTEEQFRRTLETNVLGCFRMIKAALPHLEEGASVVNTGSIVGLVGHPMLVDYTASKAAIHAFTKSLAIQFGPRKIRVNAVLPGPVWTPAIPGTMPIEEVENCGHEVALARPGQPEELAPAFVFFAASDGSFATGSLLEVTGGKLL